MENTNQDTLRCDSRDLTPGWYRFQGDAGDRIPENQCVPKLRCGSHAPGWLNGSHPAVREGAVQRKVCYHWGSNCCQWSNSVRVRNCGRFFVYELQPSPVCSLRYCGKTHGRKTLLSHFLITSITVCNKIAVSRTRRKYDFCRAVTSILSQRLQHKITNSRQF